jgi:hypothetical protein
MQSCHASQAWVRRDKDADAIRGQLLLELACLHRQLEAAEGRGGEEDAARALLARCGAIRRLLGQPDEALRAKAVRSLPAALARALGK